MADTYLFVFLILFLIFFFAVLLHYLISVTENSLNKEIHPGEVRLEKLSKKRTL